MGVQKQLIESVAKEFDLIFAKGLTDLGGDEKAGVQNGGSDDDSQSPGEFADQPLRSRKDACEENDAEERQVKDPSQHPQIRSRCKSTHEITLIFVVSFDEVDRQVG
jgi:hypothetical protein